jgi:hypothetical protein
MMHDAVWHMSRTKPLSMPAADISGIKISLCEAPHAGRVDDMSKRLGSPYLSGRSQHWIKSRNPAAPAVKREAKEDWGR